jgi:iron(III) transport system substrate-binding protein
MQSKNKFSRLKAAALSAGKMEQLTGQSLRGIFLAGMVAFAAFVMTSSSAVQAADENVVNIYSYRQEILVRPLLDRFTEMTGIEVRLVSGKADVLLQRLKSEGRNSPADILLTADAGRLHRAQEAGVLQPVRSELLDTLVPVQYREPDGYWYGLSLRARPIIIANDRVDPGELTDYEDLADEKWRGRICVRSSNSIYNQSHIASFIAHHGVAAGEQWAAGLSANFARKPAGGDRDQIRAVASGECDVALANTYYLARLAGSSNEKDSAAAAAVSIIWPNQNGVGTHVNVSGAAVTASAKNLDNAIKLIEFLAGDEAQEIYAGTVNEYPIRDGIALAPVVASWGEFKADDLDLSLLGKHNAEAVRIADRVGWQ